VLQADGASLEDEKAGRKKRTLVMRHTLLYGRWDIQDAIIPIFMAPKIFSGFHSQNWSPMLLRFFVLVSALCILNCASPHTFIDRFVPLPEVLGLDTATLPLPSGWPEACQTVNLSYAVAAECGGRNLYVMRFNYKPNEAGFRKSFEKMFRHQRMRKSTWKGPSTTFTFHGDIGEKISSYPFYDLGLFLGDGKGTVVFHCSSQFEGDSAFCSAALTRLAAKGWSELNPVQPGTSTLDFAGRTIQTGSNCRYMAGRNYQCPENGQLSWWEFNNPEDAEVALRRQIFSTSQDKEAVVMASDSVGCALEGQKTQCIINTYKAVSLDPRVLALPKLIAIYARTKVRGRHIGAVCSFYQDEQPVLCKSIFEPKDGFQPYLLSR
jgi:hypothetical protein